MAGPRGGHADEDTDSDNDPMDQDEHDLEDDGSSDEMDADESEARRREALEHMARIEKEFAELKDRLYQEKMLGLTKEIEQVNDESHSDYVEQINQLDKKKTEKMRVAELWRVYQHEVIDSIFKAESENAENDYMTERQAIRDTMITTLADKLKRLEEEKNNMDISSNRQDANHEAARAPTTRKQRRQQDPKINKKRINSGPALIPALKESEINDDLFAIRKSIPQPTRRAAAQKSSVLAHNS